MTKNEPRWFQSTLTAGAEKGSVDWLKPNDKIVPAIIEVGTALILRTDGYHIPDFIEDGRECALIIAMDEPHRRPLLIHQTTARTSVFRFLLEVKHKLIFRDEIDVFEIDEKYVLKFTRGKEKFSPFNMAATSLDD